MRYFPLYIDLADKSVLIVGGGEAALQKLRLLVKTETSIEIVAPDFHDEIRSFAAQERTKERICLLKRDFQSEDVLGKSLVYIAIEERDEVQRIGAIARNAGALVNTIDRPGISDFITPALIDRDPITIAIGTEGTAPLIARELKAKIEALVPANIGIVGRKARRIRRKIAVHIQDGHSRLRLWERLMRGGFRAAVMAGQGQKADAILEAEIKIAKTAETAGKQGFKGLVSLIGCGPGDPDLLTLRAQQCLQDADVLVIDNLVDGRVLDYARRDARRIYVGKRGGDASSFCQDEINQIIVAEALKGLRVARLKGGDPTIFGCLTQELAALQLFGIETQIVPGISSVFASANAIGLPLTNRHANSCFSILTGVTKDGVGVAELRAAVQQGNPFAIYMGVRCAAQIAGEMLKAGAVRDLAVVVVENASLANCRVIKTSVLGLRTVIERTGIKGPAIIFIGLDWQTQGLKPLIEVETYQPENILPFITGQKHINDR